MTDKGPTAGKGDTNKKPGTRRQPANEPTVTATVSDNVWTDDGEMRAIVATLLRQVVEQAPGGQILGRLVLHYDSGRVTVDNVTSDIAQAMMTQIERGSDAKALPGDDKSTAPWIKLVRLDVLAVDWTPQSVLLRSRTYGDASVSVGPTL